jgi:hypothetical protein
MWQAVVVGLVVGVATLYAAWTLLPGALRLRLATRFAEHGQRPGRPAWLARLAALVERRARAGGCADCGGRAPPPAARAAATRTRSPPRS